jgi:tetratricopeptide (TPR) repeat protein
MSKRLEILEKLTAEGKADSFGWYALALEYKSAGRIDDALRTFVALRQLDSKYVPMYLMAGSMLEACGRTAEAALWIRDGLVVAESKGDSHAASEMRDILERC